MIATTGPFAVAPHLLPLALGGAAFAAVVQGQRERWAALIARRGIGRG